MKQKKLRKVLWRCLLSFSAHLEFGDGDRVLFHALENGVMPNAYRSPSARDNVKIYKKMNKNKMVTNSWQCNYILPGSFIRLYFGNVHDSQSG